MNEVNIKKNLAVTTAMLQKVSENNKEKNFARIMKLLAMNALYRPGPIDFIPDYIRGALHPENVKYDCPQVESILKPTFGVIVYQGATCS